MNTMLMPTEMRDVVAQGTSRVSAVNQVTPIGRPPAEWLPVPTWTPTKPARKCRAPAPGKSSQSLWMQPQQQFDVELLGMGLLACAALLGIGYGFSWMVDLVQHWALFNLGVGNLIQ